MKTFFLLSILSLLEVRSDQSRFGYEQIGAYYNKEKIGRWILHQAITDKLVLNWPGLQDTLRFEGFCDSGCLDGTILKITDHDQTIAIVTRKSPILHGDSITADYHPKEKQVFQMDNGISFKVSGDVLSKLKKHKTYQVTIRRVIDVNAKDIHIFDLELN